MIIHAVSIHSGGGKVLLDQIITENPLGPISELICDSRYELPNNYQSNIRLHRISPSLFSRWKAEFLLKSLCREHANSNVLCFSNLPPALKLKNHVILYLQNALLLPGNNLYTDSLKTRLRLYYEKLWLKFFWSNINEVWVQTSWMKNELQKISNIPVILRPILLNLPVKKPNVKKYDFLTVSGFASHKRLIELLKAWSLVKSGPSLLVITDTPSQKKIVEIEKLKLNNVTFRYGVTREDIFNHYEESQCLIITSKIESYCLPIYEALHFGLKVIAPLEGYTMDIASQITVIDNFSVENLSNEIVKVVTLETK